ncbi:hypothetical protein [uncultured Roseobacter sp.]|uniref:hypothetical protein n=1 Tax=uncultured Roseobacter sp. TaxID=114847 RepID=UPI00262E10A7|nr:hypothetical protein [uncultured Roseobacter sp.]
MTDELRERALRLVFEQIGTDYTYDEAVDRANGHPDDDHTAAHHRGCIKYAEDLTDAALSVVEPLAARVLALEEALRDGLQLVSPETGWGTWPRMEGSEIYKDADTFRERARAALTQTKGET